MRIKNSEIDKDINCVLEKIKNKLEETTSPPSQTRPLLTGEEKN
jgi:very-short-patch-repair endonuclease